VHYALSVEVVEGQAELGHPEADHLLGHGAHAVEVEAEVAAQHQVEHHEEVLVVLEGVAQVADEGRVDLLEQPSLLDDVGDGPLLDAPCDKVPQLG
jgi:hypothetical protein